AAGELLVQPVLVADHRGGRRHTARDRERECEALHGVGAGAGGGGAGAGRGRDSRTSLSTSMNCAIIVSRIRSRSLTSGSTAAVSVNVCSAANVLTGAACGAIAGAAANMGLHSTTPGSGFELGSV